MTDLWRGSRQFRSNSQSRIARSFDISGSTIRKSGTGFGPTLCFEPPLARPTYSLPADLGSAGTPSSTGAIASPARGSRGSRAGRFLAGPGGLSPTSPRTSPEPEVNDDTRYKREVFALCNKLAEEKSWTALWLEFPGEKIAFEVVYEDEWQRKLNALFDVGAKTAKKTRVRAAR